MTTDAFHDPARLAALERSRLSQPETDEPFERLVRLVQRTLGVPAAFVSVLADDVAFFKAAVGLPEHVAGAVLGLNATACRYVVERGVWLLVADAAASPLIGDIPAVKAGIMGAYAGVPLVSSDGHVLGALCAADTAPRPWSTEDLATLEDYAKIAAAQVELHEAQSALHTAVHEGAQGLLARRDTEYVHAGWVVRDAVAALTPRAAPTPAAAAQR